MKTYQVSWHMPIEAESPEEAAAQALGIMRDVASIATVFTVIDDALAPFAKSYVIDASSSEHLRPPRLVVVETGDFCAEGKLS